MNHPFYMLISVGPRFQLFVRLLIIIPNIDMSIGVCHLFYDHFVPILYEHRIISLMIAYDWKYRICFLTTDCLNINVMISSHCVDSKASCLMGTMLSQFEGSYSQFLLP